MAKVKGIISIHGTLGGVNYYQSKHGLIAREAGGGFNGEAIRTKASMKRVRENGSEFGHCSKVNKHFRQAISPFYEHYKFAGLHGHLMTLFTGLKDLDTVNMRGNRQVSLGLETEEGKRMLRTFNYHPQSQLAKVMPFAARFDAEDSTLRFPDFDVTKVKFPKGATHLKLLFGVLDFDFSGMTWKCYMAAPVLIDKGYALEVLEVALDEQPSIEHTSVAVLGMRLYQRIDDVLYPLNDEAFVQMAVPFVD